MAQLTFRDCAVPLSILFMCMALNVALRENFQPNVALNTYISKDKNEYVFNEEMKQGYGGNWDRSEDAKKFEKKKPLNDLKTSGLFNKSNENTDDNSDLTNWASFDPLVGLNSKITPIEVSSFAQVTNHKA
tara:strand:+ start:10920 stop:11312 length:393 start_codon:yes stop_codon:yes gene_type:complete